MQDTEVPIVFQFSIQTIVVARMRSMGVRAGASAVLAVAPVFVCLSVTSRCSTKTANVKSHK